jgi:hypothetical protein
MKRNAFFRSTSDAKYFYANTCQKRDWFPFEPAVDAPGDSNGWAFGRKSHKKHSENIHGGAQRDNRTTGCDPAIVFIFGARAVPGFVRRSSARSDLNLQK